MKCFGHFFSFVRQKPLKLHMYSYTDTHRVCSDVQTVRVETSKK